MQPPELVAQGAFDLTEYGWSGFDKDPDTLRMPASTLKVLTLFVARRWVTDSMLQDNCIVSAEDEVGAGESTANLGDGDVLTWDELFHAMMLPSGNDAANCIARTVGNLINDAEGTTSPPKARFLAHMNEVTESVLGWPGRTYGTASGAVLPESWITPRELCQLALSLDNYAVSVMGTLTRTVTIGGPNARSITYTNTTNPDGAVKFPEFVGAKTGTIAGSWQIANLVILWNDHNGRHATAILGSWPQAQRFVDARAVMDYVKTLTPPPPELPDIPAPAEPPRLPTGAPSAYRVRTGGLSVDVHTVKAKFRGLTLTIWSAT